MPAADLKHWRLFAIRECGLGSCVLNKRGHEPKRDEQQKLHSIYCWNGEHSRCQHSHCRCRCHYECAGCDVLEHR